MKDIKTIVSLSLNELLLIASALGITGILMRGDLNDINDVIKFISTDSKSLRSAVHDLYITFHDEVVRVHKEMKE